MASKVERTREGGRVKALKIEAGRQDVWNVGAEEGWMLKVEVEIEVERDGKLAVKISQPENSQHNSRQVYQTRQDTKMAVSKIRGDDQQTRRETKML